MLSDALRNLVLSKGMTQKDVAKELNISQQRFNFYVNGSREPDIETLILLADYFNVTVDYLIGHEKEPAAKGDELTAHEHDLILAYRAASPDDRAIIDNIVSRYTQAAEAHRLA